MAHRVVSTLRTTEMVWSGHEGFTPSLFAVQLFRCCLCDLMEQLRSTVLLSQAPATIYRDLLLCGS